jgi:predicted  nucleic acid-binding Zn-ribbon protein
MQEATRIIKEKKATFDNDLHRLTRERDDKESQLQSTAQELDATRTALQRSQRQIRDLESNAKELRRQKGEVESQLRKAERAAEGHATASSELDSVKEQLRSKTDALQTVETELKTVRKDLAASQKKAAGLQESHDQMQFDVSEKRSAVEQSNKDKVAVQNLQAQVRTLQQKNSDLQTNIDTLRSKDGSDLKDAQARFSVEKRRLEEQVKGLQSAKQSSEQELQRVQKEVADKSKETKTRYDADVASLKARLEQSSQAAKELEDKVKSVEERKERELEAHKKVSEKKIEEKFAAQAQAYQKKMEERLSEELQRQAEEAAKVHTYPNSQPDSSRTSPQAQSSQGPSTSLGTLSTMNIHAKPKKKVDRQNHSVFSVHSSASNVLAGSTPFPTAISAETAYVLHHHEDPEDHEETHPDELGAQEYLDEIVVSLREPPPGTVPDTQEVQLSFEQLNQLLMQRAADDQSSSSQLSEVNEELLDSLKPYDMAIPKGHARIAGRSPLKEMAGDQIVHSRHVLESPSRETDPHERPKSRANTASRMVPPGYQHPSDEASLRGQTTPKTGNGGRSRAMSHRNGDNTSSPDYVQKPSSSGPVTYGQHSGRSATSHVVPRGTWPLPSVDGSSHKRKSSAAHTDRTPSGKRSRVSPQYATAETPRRSQAKSNMPSSSAGSYNSQSQMRSSYASGKNSSAGSAARSGRTKSMSSI